MNDIQLMLSFASIFFGVLLRTLLPAIKKLQTGATWDHTYTATAAFTIITSFVVAVLAFPTFNIPTNIEGEFGVFIISFTFGWGLNDLYNSAFADLQTPSTDTTSTSPQTQTPPASSPGTVSANASLGTYKTWTVTIENYFLTLTPPANLVSRFGQKLSIGSVAGWTSSNAFAEATKYIDGLLALPVPDANAKQPGSMP